MRRGCSGPQTHTEGQPQEDTGLETASERPGERPQEDQPRPQLGPGFQPPGLERVIVCCLSCPGCGPLSQQLEQSKHKAKSKQRVASQARSSWWAVLRQGSRPLNLSWGRAVVGCGLQGGRSGTHPWRSFPRVVGNTARGASVPEAHLG